MLIVYARVSTQAQSLDRQIGALRGLGVERIFREKATANGQGPSTARKGYRRARYR